MRIREPQDIGTDLRAWLHRQGLSDSEFAKKISREVKGLHVSQSWVSRIAAGKFRRLTPKIRSVADYASIRVSLKGEHDKRGAVLIDEAVKVAWNGSLSHANLIAKLIKAGKGLSAKD